MLAWVSNVCREVSIDCSGNGRMRNIGTGERWKDKRWREDKVVPDCRIQSKGQPKPAQLRPVMHVA